MNMMCTMYTMNKGVTLQVLRKEQSLQSGVVGLDVVRIGCNVIDAYSQVHICEARVAKIDSFIIKVETQRRKSNVYIGRVGECNIHEHFQAPCISVRDVSIGLNNFDQITCKPIESCINKKKIKKNECALEFVVIICIPFNCIS